MCDGPHTMSDLPSRILAFIQKERLIEPNQSVLVGVSGGIDSTALLSVLTELKNSFPFSLAAAHVNHMLRGQESERDENFVRNLTQRLSLPLHVKRVNVQCLAESSGKSIQHAGRDARYEYFTELTETHRYERIAIAHNQDDQVETFVLRIIKGTGIRGLSCIPVKRGRIVRPLLNTVRKEIEQYAVERGLSHVEDSSNTKDGYERNYVRHRVLPAMERLNPTVQSRIISLLGDLTRLNERLDQEAMAFMEGHVSRAEEGVIIPVKQLVDCAEEMRFRVLSLVLADLAYGFIALREHIRLIEKVLLSSRPNSSAVLPFGITVRKEYDRLFCTTAVTAPQVSEIFPVKPGENVIEPLQISVDISLAERVPHQFPKDRYTAILDGDRISELSVRTFREGDRFVPLGMKSFVKVKDYFISRKIPKNRRREIPLMVIGDSIVWIIGERLDDRFKVTEGTTKVVSVTAKRLSTSSGL